MDRFKLYVFDIDGTILTTRHQILPSTKQAMALLTQAGGQIMLASARPPKAVDPIVKELNLEPFYISLNGALVVQNDQILFEEPMNFEVAQEVIGRALSQGLSVNCYTAWDWFIEKPNYWSTREGNIVGYHGEVTDLKTIKKAHKLLLIGEPEVVSVVQNELIQHVPQVSGSLSSPNYLEVVAKGVSKAHALEVVSELVKIELKDMVAFGDGENDLPMLNEVGFAVAMGNAHPDLKKAAHLITSSNDEDGIFIAIQTILG